MGSRLHRTEIILAQLVQWFQQTAANSRLYLVIRRGEGLAGWRAALRKCSKLFSESSGDFGQQGELCWARFGQSGDIEHFFLEHWFIAPRCFVPKLRITLHEA